MASYILRTKSRVIWSEYLWIVGNILYMTRESRARNPIWYVFDMLWGRIWYRCFGNFPEKFLSIAPFAKRTLGNFLQQANPLYPAIRSTSQFGTSNTHLTLVEDDIPETSVTYISRCADPATLYNTTIQFQQVTHAILFIAINFQSKETNSIRLRCFLVSATMIIEEDSDLYCRLYWSKQHEKQLREE